MGHIRNADWDTWTTDGALDNGDGGFSFGIKAWREYAKGYQVHCELMLGQLPGEGSTEDASEEDYIKLYEVGYALIDWLNGRRSRQLKEALERAEGDYDPDEDPIAALVGGNFIGPRIWFEDGQEDYFLEIAVAGDMKLHMSVGGSYVTRTKAEELFFNNMRCGGLTINDWS